MYITEYQVIKTYMIYTYILITTYIKIYIAIVNVHI